MLHPIYRGLSLRSLQLPQELPLDTKTRGCGYENDHSRLELAFDHTDCLTNTTLHVLMQAVPLSERGSLVLITQLCDLRLPGEPWLIWVQNSNSYYTQKKKHQIIWDLYVTDTGIMRSRRLPKNCGHLHSPKPSLSATGNHMECWDSLPSLRYVC